MIVKISKRYKMLKEIIKLIGKPTEIKKDLIIMAYWNITTQKVLNILKKSEKFNVVKGFNGYYIITTEINGEIKRIDVFNGKGDNFRMVISENDLKELNSSET